MIDRQEILEFARELTLAPNIVEKDYALGWLLAGIFHHPALQSGWLFKGGTCLKKCYFETYRFSEDLDFTVLDAHHLDQTFLVKTFEEVTSWVYDQSGMEVPRDAISFEVYTNTRGNVSVEGRIGYRGPLGMRGTIPRIKLDLTSDECLVCEPVWREVHHPYSDRPPQAMEALCYCFEELFAEKIRAMTERMRPRDLYDVVHLYRHGDETCNRQQVVDALQQKCRFKGIEVPSARSLANHAGRAELVSEWKNMLAHQLPKLPPLEIFDQELPRVFAWLFAAEAKPTVSAMAMGANEDSSWRAPAMVTSWGLTVPLEAIRFAAANHLCVDLTYDGSRRLIEPYSLRRTRDGEILLHALRHESGEPRSYRVDRIQAAEVTDVAYTPRYIVELTPSGPLTIPNQTRRIAGTGWGGLTRHVLSGPRGRSGTLEYVVECPLCGKRFHRKKYNTRLNKHKDKSGFDCLGRNGFLVDRRF